MWSSGQLAILVQQSPGIFLCLMYLRLVSKAIEFDSPSDHSLGGNWRLCKVMWGHWNDFNQKSLCSSEELPGELLGLERLGENCSLGKRESVHVCVCVHSRSVLNPAEGRNGPHMQSSRDVGCQLGPQSVGRWVLDKNPCSYLRGL